VVSALAATGLCHSFGGVTALRDVDVSMSAGELVGVIGPNGSGKTTLVDALTGMLVPERGTIALDGVDVTGRDASALARRGLARTFQTTRLMEPLSTRDNVMLGLHTAPIRGGRRRRDRVDTLLGILGIAELGDRVVRDLSHGQRRRVELARALAAEPHVLILDEPTAGLAASDAAEVARLLAGIALSGTAILMIEHDLGVVAAACTRLVVLDAGAVVDHGPTRSVLEGPAVAELRGELGHDRLEAVPA
jgi:ABC-type branched-subunit amino acid transport system ATPase component